MLWIRRWSGNLNFDSHITGIGKLNIQRSELPLVAIVEIIENIFNQDFGQAQAVVDYNRVRLRLMDCPQRVRTHPAGSRR